MSDDLRLPWRKLSKNYVVDAAGVVVTAEAILRLAAAVPIVLEACEELESRLRWISDDRRIDLSDDLAQLAIIRAALLAAA